LLASEAGEPESESALVTSFDDKYDELHWFRRTRVTAYGMNVFRCWVHAQALIEQIQSIIVFGELL
jgi:hypothetical protein